MKVSYPKLHSIRMKNHENVEWLGNVTTLDLDPQILLLSAINQQLKEVVILGYDKDGMEYFSSSAADGPRVLWHIERAKKKLIEITDTEEELQVTR